MRRLAAALILATLTSCAPAPSAAAPEAAKKQVVEAVMGMYQAFQQADLPKVGKYMTEDSTCYDATQSVLLTGRKAVLEHFGAILAQHKPGEAWESSIEGMNVTLSWDMAYATYQVRTSAGGMHAVAAVTHVFERRGEVWLAVHLHRSWNAQPK
ncbi:MAG TPA: nuclear transport factor 2 family protein [Planctomycetota bacterium]|nr:nuclear transport factor 2 family protein [Planctomycetota bacterium]